MSLTEEEKERLAAEEEVRERVRKSSPRTWWDYANSPAVLWGLGIVALSVVPFVYKGCEGYAAQSWRRWDTQRKLTVELRYRVSRAVESLQPRDANGNEVNEKDEAKVVECILNNTEDQYRSNFTVPEYRDRSLASLEWELVASYYGGREKERVEAIRNRNRQAMSLLSGGDTCKRLQALKTFEESFELLKGHWREVMDRRPFFPQPPTIH